MGSEGDEDDKVDRGQSVHKSLEGASNWVDRHKGLISGLFKGAAFLGAVAVLNSIRAVRNGTKPRSQ